MNETGFKLRDICCLNSGVLRGPEKGTFRDDNMKTKNLRVEGMHCRSCEMLLEDALKEIGVSKSKLSYEKGKVTVTFDESLVSMDDIKERIREEGYEVVE